MQIRLQEMVPACEITGFFTQEDNWTHLETSSKEREQKHNI